MPRSPKPRADARDGSSPYAQRIFSNLVSSDPAKLLEAHKKLIASPSRDAMERVVREAKALHGAPLKPRVLPEALVSLLDRAACKEARVGWAIDWLCRARHTQTDEPCELSPWPSVIRYGRVSAARALADPLTYGPGSSMIRSTRADLDRALRRKISKSRECLVAYTIQALHEDARKGKGEPLSLLDLGRSSVPSLHLLRVANEYMHTWAPEDLWAHWTELGASGAQLAEATKATDTDAVGCGLLVQMANKGRWELVDAMLAAGTEWEPITLGYMDQGPFKQMQGGTLRKLLERGAPFEEGVLKHLRDRGRYAAAKAMASHWRANDEGRLAREEGIWAGP